MGNPSSKTTIEGVSSRAHGGWGWCSWPQVLWQAGSVWRGCEGDWRACHEWLRVVLALVVRQVWHGRVLRLDPWWWQGVLTVAHFVRRTQVRGGYEGQNPKNHWGIIFGPKMMILQGVGRQKPYVGVSYANDPKKGGYTTPAHALDLTTSLRGDFIACLWGNAHLLENIPVTHCPTQLSHYDRSSIRGGGGGVTHNKHRHRTGPPTALARETASSAIYRAQPGISKGPFGAGGIRPIGPAGLPVTSPCITQGRAWGAFYKCI